MDYNLLTLHTHAEQTFPIIILFNNFCTFWGDFPLHYVTLAAFITSLQTKCLNISRYAILLPKKEFNIFVNFFGCFQLAQALHFFLELIVCKPHLSLGVSVYE